MTKNKHTNTEEDPRPTENTTVDAGLTLPFVAGKIEQAEISSLRVSNQSLRKHSKGKLAKLRANIEQFGFVLPLIVDAHGRVLAGNARLEIARQLRLSSVPVIRVMHLSAAQAKLFSIADNRLVELSSWNEQALKLALEEIIELEPELEVELAGFETAQIDSILEIDLDGMETSLRDDDLAPALSSAVSRLGDKWSLGKHQLFCADATDDAAINGFLGEEEIDLTATDAPYNVPIIGHVRGKTSSKTQDIQRSDHREFVQASGEMTDAEFETLLNGALSNAQAHSRNGALIYCYMDWRSIELLLRCGRQLGMDLINVAVWNKNNGGMGSFYRSKHELCAIFRVGDVSHVNNIQLGATGRYRTNVWDYAGVNSFGRNRNEALAAHPTVKPAAMIADIIKDASKRGDLIFDPFAGSGTAFIAAERTGRRCYGIELDPLYVDTIIARFEKRFDVQAVHAETGLTWLELKAQREQDLATTDTAPNLPEAPHPSSTSSSRPHSDTGLKSSVGNRDSKLTTRSRTRPAKSVPTPA